MKLVHHKVLQMNPFRAIYDFFYIKYKMWKLRRQDPYIYEEE